jgi:hypothetical protein
VVEVEHAVGAGRRGQVVDVGDEQPGVDELFADAHAALQPTYVPLFTHTRSSLPGVGNTAAGSVGAQSGEPPPELWSEIANAE